MDYESLPVFNGKKCVMCGRTAKYISPNPKSREPLCYECVVKESEARGRR